MSTDSTELTFIRCPSCRSLVPAVSPRCRMCGAVLDSGKGIDSGSAEQTATSEGSNDNKGSNRVRQQTVVVSDQELRAAKDAFGGQAQSKNPYSQETEVSTSKAEDLSSGLDDNTDFGDPLGAFIEEVPVDSGSDLSNAMEGKNQFESSEINDEEIKGGELNGKSKHDLTDHDSSVESAQNTGWIRPRTGSDAGIRKNPSQSVGSQIVRTRTESSTTRRPIIQETRKDPDAFNIDAETSARSRSGEQNDRFEDFDNSQLQRAKGKSSPRPKEPKPVENVNKGRLFGWLVTYKDPQGEAFELRDGKFFVSKASLKNTDLILDDESISTPHALIGVNVNGDLLVQDLMSERGVFVRKGLGAEYQRVLENTKLENGDWLRFGEVEFLVAIIARAAEQV